MSRPHPHGVALILVISIIGLMGITLTYLAQSCRSMLFQTDLEYLRVVERNLVASGLAWAKRQNSELRTQNPGERTDTAVLDVNEVGGTKARLSVRIEDGNDTPALAHLEISLSRGPQAVQRARTFQIPPGP